MSLFIRLSTLVTIAFLLRCVSATVVITAPSTTTDSTAGLETREQGPTAWICSALAVDSPWTSYANIRGYLEGGNVEKKDYSNLVLYPVMELFHASESRLCVYLPAEDHCYPPAPSTSQVKAVKQLSKQKYYAIRFWGQASDARVQYYRQKLTAALKTQSKAANFELFFVSFFSDHVREVRYDPATTGQGRSAEPLQSQLICPAAPGYNISSTRVQLAGQEYFRTTILESRLNLSDVQTKALSGSNIQSHDACAAAAFSEGQNAFSYVSGVCKVYNFGEHFCPCAPGDLGIFINTKLLGESKELPKNKIDIGLKEMVVYLEISMDQLPSMLGFIQVANRSRCDAALADSPISGGVIVMNNRCFPTFVHDLANCNQTCRGRPFDAFIRKVDPISKVPILSLCGQKNVVPKMGGDNTFYISHAGYGCYPYQAAKTAGEGDCIVTFERGANSVLHKITIGKIDLNSDGRTCLDELSIYNGSTTADASKLFNGCSGDEVFNGGTHITIKFRRGRLSSINNAGFLINVQSR